ncbi:AMP-binding protein [Agaribacterium haliotis]|uniref:AMP-binding protein n=1 Tax=Agaribacterium haliotis TaxID=2013869 RepID=UPI000BB59980|nr:AMP-binding protein [Agaribacterium haliotis]
MRREGSFDLACELWHGLLESDERGIHFFDEETLSFSFYSYRSLLLRAAQVALSLEQLGVNAKHRVLLCAQNSPEFVLTWLALWMRGATPVPMPPSMTMSGNGGFSSRVAPLLKHHQFFICEQNDHVIWQSLEHAADVQFISMKSLCRSALREDISKLSVPELNSTKHWDEEAFIQYTSGSTSAPKGIVISYRNVFHNVDEIFRRIHPDPERDSYISWLPTYHDYGLIANFMLCLMKQVSLVLVSPFYFVKRPLKFLKFVEDFQASYLCMPNFALEMINRSLSLKAPAPENLNLSSLKWWSVAAEPISIDAITTLEKNLACYGLRSGVFNPSYGLAEATVGVSGKGPDGGISIYGDKHKYVCNGPFLDGFDYEIRDPDKDGAGRLHIRSDSVARWVYVNGDKQSLVDERGFVDTRDIALMHDGELVVFGRGDEMFCRNGENVFPYDVESYVRKQQALQVRRVACFNLDDGAQGRLVLLVESRIKDKNVFLDLAESLNQKIFSEIGIAVDDLVLVKAHSIPVTTSGKIQRSKAAELYRLGEFASVTQCELDLS